MKKPVIILSWACSIVVIGIAREGRSFANPAGVPMGAVEQCEADCRICVPEPAKTKTSKTVYDVKCVDYCLPRCPHFSLRHACDGCATVSCPRCGKPRVRRILVKKTVTQERDTFKCVIQSVP